MVLTDEIASQLKTGDVLFSSDGLLMLRVLNDGQSNGGIWSTWVGRRDTEELKQGFFEFIQKGTLEYATTPLKWELSPITAARLQKVWDAKLAANLTH
jgi:hypothetical protein